MHILCSEGCLGVVVGCLYSAHSPIYLKSVFSTPKENSSIEFH